MAVLVLCPATEKEVRSQLPWDSEMVDYNKLCIDLLKQRLGYIS